MTTGSTSLEVEWQFEAPDLAAVERWLRAQPTYASAALDDRGEKTQRDIYLDSADWRVFHAGYSLRVRTKGDASEVTLKALARGTRGPVRRAEFSEAGEIDLLATSEGPVGERLRLILRGAPLRPLLTVTTRRHTWVVRSASTDLAEVALDDTTVDSDGVSATLGRVEIEEIEPGGLEAVQTFVHALQSACALIPAATSKFEAGLLAAGLRPAPPDLGPTGFTPDDRASDRAYAILRRRLGELLINEGGTALGEDPESLHQMRVATRRLRAALQVFETALPTTLLNTRGELRWLAQSLGAVRDLDVQLERLDALRRASPWDDSNALAPLATQFERARVEARTALLAVLDDDRYARLVGTARDLLIAGPPAEAPDEPSRVLGRRIIARRYRQFRREARLLRRSSPHADYHAVRIRGKRLRYSLELFIDLYGRDGALALASLRRLQDLLGELQDLATTDERLRLLVQTHAAELPPDTLVMIGRLTEQHRVRAVEVIDAFPRTYAAVLRRFDRLRRTPGWRRPAPRVEETPDVVPDVEPEPIAFAPAPSDVPAPRSFKNAAWTLPRLFRRNRP